MLSNSLINPIFLRPINDYHLVVKTSPGFFPQGSVFFFIAGYFKSFLCIPCKRYCSHSTPPFSVNIQAFYSLTFSLYGVLVNWLTMWPSSNLETLTCFLLGSSWITWLTFWKDWQTTTFSLVNWCRNHRGTANICRSLNLIILLHFRF